MQLAFVLYKYFPYGGLQRDFLRIALECQRRGHGIRVYTMSWDGAIPEGFEVILRPVRALTNHRRNERFARKVLDELEHSPVDRVVGFNKMPGLDVYYAADPCFEEKIRTQRGPLYRLSARYRHFARFERDVFSPAARAEILLISEVEQPYFARHYRTPPERFHVLPPGIAADRRAPADAAQVRAALRQELGLADQDLLLVQIGSGFKTKGLDRSIEALAALPAELRARTRLAVIGQDNPAIFQAQAKRLNVAEQVDFLGGRDDVPRFLLGADLLIHPAYSENTGTVLLEALVSGLPVLTSAACGYAHYIEEADCGLVVPAPFEQSVLNNMLVDILSDADLRQRWHRQALEFADRADLYSLPEKAADVILGARP